MSFAIPRIRIIAVVIAVALVLTTIGFTVGVRAAGHDTPVVFVASGENFPDGLGSGPAAALNRGPVLLVRQNSIPAATAAELTRLNPDRIVVVGGPAAVSNAVETQLAAYAADVDRVGGSDRYGTAAEVSQEFFPATLPAGPPGPPGPPGPAGPDIKTYVVKVLEELDPGEEKMIRADCEVGDQATGGGFEVATTTQLSLSRAQRGADNTAVGWEIEARNGGSSAVFVTAEAICLDLTP